MSFHFKMNNLIKLFCLIVILPNIKSDCIMKYTDSIEIAPKFERIMGKFNVKIPFGRSDENFIQVQDGDSVHGYCESYFRPIGYKIDSYYKKTVSNQTDCIFNCRDSTLFYNNYKLLDQKLSCLEPSWRVYSTKKPYDWCENNQNSTTFLFAAEKVTEKNIFAAICYNIEQLSFQTLVYNTTNLQYNNFKKPVDATNVISSDYIDETLWNFKTSIVSDLSEKALQKNINEMRKRDEWMNLANYEVSLIVQNEFLIKYFKEYENVLNIIWWHNLRVGNWKRFQNSFTNYAHNNSYEVFMGTSGVAQYPTDNKCHKEKYLEVKLGFHNQTVPAYIWTYLKSIDNLNKDFVIIGFNSPFAEYFTTEKVIFCPNICSEIPWLKEVSASFHYSYAGIMFCCSTDFIKQTNYLQGFPYEISLPQQVIMNGATATSEIVEFATETVSAETVSTETDLI